MTDSLWLSSSAPLQPADAVGAIILTQSGRYLLQLRDDLDWIFYPNHWGLFGGAIDPGEDAPTALLRELEEELGLVLQAKDLVYFTRTTFDWSFAGFGNSERIFYEVVIPDERLATLVLTEGAAMKAFQGPEMLSTSVALAPYDGFALWMHYSRHRIRA